MLMRQLFILLLFSLSAGKTYSQDNMLWLPEKCKANRYILLQYLNQCDSLGLDKKDYNFGLLLSLDKTPFAEDTVSADKAITLSAIQFFHDVVYGINTPYLEFNGLNKSPEYINIPYEFYKSLEEGAFGDLLKKIEPANTAYTDIKKMIARYLLKLADSSLHPDIVSSYLVDSTNHPLVERLYQLGYLDSLDYHLPEKTMREQLRRRNICLNSMKMEDCDRTY
jgi:hypothetical protein